ncbi:DUF434 domain-containing protein [Mucilaginibacter sp. CSA2-8R]|uniref:DUF434 domain-containing protein n=1 Tax=Mucilaginibacter sp. CSA2-8R TaxID=3141542 RepID=UPI00315C55CF
MTEVQPETRRNRGKDPEDDVLFGPVSEQQKLLTALDDMHYLLSKDYPPRATLALVGNRYRLRQRQILALQGMACSAQDINGRREKEVSANFIKGNTIFLDGFNVLIVMETLLSGGFVFRGLDGCYRDISSVHGSYKRVRQTLNVLVIIGQALQQLGAEKVVWIFDAPISNSGRLKTLCYEIAAHHQFAWDVYLDNSPDKYLVSEPRLIASSDAWVLNHCHQWFNLLWYMVGEVLNKGEGLNIIPAEI